VEIAGKVAVVTGSGGGGQGRALALRLAREGAVVVVSDIDETGGAETVRRIESAGGRALFVRADMAQEREIEALIATTEQMFGGLDILVNNAGPYFPGDRFHRWQETIQANLLGAICASLRAIEFMRRRGGGAILCYGSTSAIGHGRKHSPGPLYDVAKAGVARFVTTMGWLRDAHNIRINCIVPAWVATNEVQAYVDAATPEQRRERGVPDTLIGLDEISTAAIRLITDESLFGRVLVWWNGQPPALIPEGDPGYAALEPFAL
jgi:NAD(P)-dependent dehydrogenase (short-subunit alcohol dehydrogenase family)